jgi:hypothetical protein
LVCFAYNQLSMGRQTRFHMLSLVPLLDDIDVQSQQAVQDFTDGNGEYILRSEAAGRYVLSVLWNAPPSTKHPFLTRFYPDAPDQSHAEILELAAARHLSLVPIKLVRVGLVKVPVSVSWSNGKPEPDAYLFFTNTLMTIRWCSGSHSTSATLAVAAVPSVRARLHIA